MLLQFRYKDETEGVDLKFRSREILVILILRPLVRVGLKVEGRKYYVSVGTVAPFLLLPYFYDDRWGLKGMPKLLTQIPWFGMVNIM